MLFLLRCEILPRHTVSAFRANSDTSKNQILKEAELLVNITEHTFVPRHKVLSNEEKVALLAKYRVKETQESHLRMKECVTMKRRQEDSALPTDVLAEILLRVSAKSLVKLKHVSESWHRVITNNYFVKQHVCHWRSRGGVVFNTLGPDNLKMDKISYLCPVDVRDDVWIVNNYNISLQDFVRGRDFGPLMIQDIQSYDGLLLIKPAGPVNGEFQLLVCNPTTRLFKVVPLVYEMQGCCWTIGYDPSDGCYKIVGLKAVSAYRCFLCYTFELHRDNQGPSSWKVVQGALSLGNGIIEAVVYTMGKAHWLLSWCPKDRRLRLEGFLVSLDLATREISSRELLLISWPCSLAQVSYHGSNGKFYHVTCTSFDKFALWIMKDFDDPIWLKQHVFSTSGSPCLQASMSSLSLNASKIIPKLKVICTEDDKMTLRYRESLFVYDIKTTEWRRIVVDSYANSDMFRFTDWYHLVYHVNSLISWD